MAASDPDKWHLIAVSSDEAKRSVYINGRRVLVLSGARLTRDALNRHLGNPFEETP